MRYIENYYNININMRHRLILMVLATMISLQTIAQTSKKQLSAVFSYATFQRADGQNYVESYISFDAWNLNFLPQQDGKLRATVQVILQVYKGDSLVDARKNVLRSPAIDKDQSTNFNFIDLQRVALDNGDYNMKIWMKDMGDEQSDYVEVEQHVSLHYDKKTPRMSSVVPLASVTPTTTQNMMSRGGYDMEPYVNDYYPASVGVMNYYFEIYNIANEVKGGEFMVISYIEDQETGRQMENTLQGRRMSLKDSPIFNGSSANDASSQTSVLGSMDISMIPSGNFNLVVEIRTKKNDLILYQKVPFIRSNPSVANEIAPVSASFAGMITDESQMNFYLKALYPIALEAERVEAERLATQAGRLTYKQEFFYNFWLRRDNLNPEGKWREYKDRLDYVTNNFSYPLTPGYMTDFGRVYLKYGAPDYVRDEKNYVSTRRIGANSTQLRSIEQQMAGNDNALSGSVNTSTGQLFYLPYQFWRYNNLPGQDINRVFLFWDEHRSGYYKLLNSNAIGEVREADWERRLSQQQLGEGMKGDVGEQFDRGY